MKTLNLPSASPIGLGAEITNHRGHSTVPCFQHFPRYSTEYSSGLCDVGLLGDDD